MDNPSSATKTEVFTSIRRLVQARLRKMQDDWFSKKAEEIQDYVDRKDSKCFYDSLRAFYSP